MKEKKPPKTTPQSSRARNLKQEDLTIWGAATSDVTKLTTSNIITPLPPKRPQMRSAPNITGKITLETFAVPIASHQASSFQIDANLKKKFERGELPIDGKIDLHGLTLEQAHTQFTKFMTRSIKEGARFILVITGKGSSESENGKGIIRKNLPLWCGDKNLKPFILQTREAQPKHGGSGATYILLRKLKG